MHLVSKGGMQLIFFFSSTKKPDLGKIYRRKQYFRLVLHLHQVFELHEHFDELGAGGARVHLLDADDPDNARIIAWEVRTRCVLGRGSGW